MAKRIAVISYDLDPNSPPTVDAVVVRDTLITAGYQATLVHQWRLNETNPATFFSAADWLRAFDGIVICDFYQFWNLREVILSKLPVICLNPGYADDLGLAEKQVTYTAETACKVVHLHPITTGLAIGTHNLGNAVYVHSVSVQDHSVNVLATTVANNPTLIAHKTHKLVFFGWFRMSSASNGSALFKLLNQAAHWAF